MFFSKLVEGNEKFFALMLTALAVYVQDTNYIADQPLKTLIIGIIGAGIMWLTTSTEIGTAAKKEAEVKVEAAKVEAKAESDAAVVKAEADTELDEIEENAP